MYYNFALLCCYSQMISFVLMDCSYSLDFIATLSIKSYYKVILLWLKWNTASTLILSSFPRGIWLIKKLIVLREAVIII